MLKRNWALIALVYLAFAEVLSWAPVPDLSLCLIKPEESEQSADSDKKYCPAFHTGAAVALKNVDSFLEHHDKSVVGGFTIVLAISTIGLWLATNKLWEAGEKQFRLLSETGAAQSRDMQKSIKAASDYARAANRAAEIAEKAMILNDRAWLDFQVEIEGPLIFTEEGCRIRLKSFVKNVGRTPALKVAHDFELVVGLGPALDRHRKMQTDAKNLVATKSYGPTLFPDRTIEQNSRTLTGARSEMEKAIESDKEGILGIYVVGCATYFLPSDATARFT